TQDKTPPVSPAAPKQPKKSITPAKPSAKAAEQVTSADPPTDAPLTRAQEQAMDQLVEALFLPESEQNASLPPDAAVSLPPSSQVAPSPSSTEEKLPAEEARAALLATFGQQAKPSPKAVNQALDALAQTMDHSSEANPPPPVNDPHLQMASKVQPPIAEGERVTPRELASIMSLEERSPTAKYPPVDLLQYTIQIGAFEDEVSAVKLIGQLQVKGYDLYLQEIQEGKEKIWYRVSIGRLENEEQARALLKRFTDAEGKPGFITPVARLGTSTVGQSLPFADPPLPVRANPSSGKPQKATEKSLSHDTPASAEPHASTPVAKRAEPHVAALPPSPAQPKTHDAARPSSPVQPETSASWLHALEIPEANAASFQPPESTSLKGFAVQVAAFRNPMDTEKRLEQLAPQGFDLHLCETRDAKGYNWQMIWIGRYDTKQSAQEAAEGFFQKSGEAAQVVEIRPSTPEDPQLITRIGGGM
ncbi:MAG: SPOR domain-containing protein, partial [Magnetococcales bacterium]|nr:SPOR domain-containing protein [Magnetococcales bacterium]